MRKINFAYLIFYMFVSIYLVTKCLATNEENLNLMNNNNNNQEPNVDIIPESETTGSCAEQLSPELHRRNCRYGRCEQIRNGTDFVCHCDNYITGKRCDRGTKDPNDACSSNPCWGDSICIVLENEHHSFKCLCTSSRNGKYCQLLRAGNGQESELDYGEQYSSEVETEKVETVEKLRADETSPDLENQASSTPQSNLKGDTLNNLKILFLNSMNRTIAEEKLKNYSLILGEDENGNISRFDGTDFLYDPDLNGTTKPNYKQRNVTTRGLYNTYVPTSDYHELCNYNTCQLGKCLENGTCECVKPAIGKFCDQIDECLVLKCVNGECVTGKGCICKQGFYGSTCEFNSNSTVSDDALKSNGVPKQAKLVDDDPQNISNLDVTISGQTLLPTTTLQTETTFYKNEISETITTTSTTTTKDLPRLEEILGTSTQIILKCENGGLLIDNLCICLNQFTGQRCEIAPIFSEQTIDTNPTREPELESIPYETRENMESDKIFYKEKSTFFETITTTSTALPTETTTTTMSTTISTTTTSTTTTSTTVETSTGASAIGSLESDQSESDDEIVPVFTLSRYNVRTKNSTIHRSIYWPWFECFPGDSFVYVQKNKEIIKKSMFEIEINDMVLVGSGLESSEQKFSKVISFLHRIEEIEANFIKLYFKATEYLSTKSENLTEHLTITPRHLILAKRSSHFEYVQARDVQSGDILKFFNNEKQQMSYVEVTKVESVRLENSGIYSPLTESGTLIVDNIHVSCFSLVKSHYLANVVFNFFNSLINFTNLNSYSSELFVAFTQILFNIVDMLKVTDLFLRV